MKEQIADDRLDAVAREIRTPAGVTWSALEELAFVVSQYPTRDDRHLEEVLGMARLGVQRLLNLADRLALMSELDDSHLDLQRCHVDLRDVVEEAVGHATYLAGRKSISTTTTLGEKSVIVHADVRWLGAAILELCANALRFARSAIRIHLFDDPMLLLIEDDGPGFKSTGPTRVGFGDSLRLATRVIDAHGGTLEQRASTLPARCERPGAGVAVMLPAPSGLARSPSGQLQAALR